MNTKAAIYCRLSEEDKNKKSVTDESYSIQNQKSMLIKYAEEHGWEIYDIYSDDDYTGADRSRPAFKRLLNDAEQHKFDIILCKTQSRFTRELELVEKYIHGLFPIWGIRFISVVDNTDSSDKGNKKSRQINGLINEWYLEDMSENIRSVLTNRRQNGLHIGSFALYGYKKDPEHKGHLIIDEEAASIVREIFTLFAQGYGKTAIARILNEKGIPNPTEYKRLCGLRYKPPASANSTLWSYSTISDMLTNEIYIGNMVQGKYGSISYKTKQNKPRPQSEWYIVKETHEPIIEYELWDTVQKLISQRAKPFKSGTVGIFAGKARCSFCASSMRSVQSHGRQYLKCSRRHLSKDLCIGAFISVEKLEELVLNELSRLSDLYLDKDILYQKLVLHNDLQTKREHLSSSIALYKKKSAEYSKAIRNLYIDKTKGILSEIDFTNMAANFSDERIRTEKLISEYTEQLSMLREKIESSDERHKLIEQYTTPAHLTHELVDILIDHINIGRRISGTKDVPIEIHWNF